MRRGDIPILAIVLYVYAAQVWMGYVGAVKIGRVRNAYAHSMQACSDE